MASGTPSTAGDSTTGVSRLHPSRVAAGAKSRPASSVGLVAAALVLLAKKLGVDLTAEDSAVIVALLAKGAEFLAERLAANKK